MPTARGWLWRAGLLGAATLAPVIVLARAPLDTPDRYMARQLLAMREGDEDLPRANAAPRYTIRATVSSDGTQVAGTAWITVTNPSSVPMDTLPLRLYANIPALYGGATTVTRAHSEGEELLTTLSENGSLIELEYPVGIGPGRQLRAEVDFVTRLGRGTGYGILATSGGVTRLAGWYPAVPRLRTVQRGDAGSDAAPRVGDAAEADIGYFDVHLRVPSPWVVVTTGSEVAHVDEGTTTAWNFVSGPAREFAVAAGPGLHRSSAFVDDINVYHYTTQEGGAMTAAAALEAAQRTVSVLQRRFGPYPYRELDVVETGITIGGYEFPGLVMIDQVTRTRGGRAEAEWLIIHEIAHQWWYGLVGSPTIEEPWLDESFATYAVALVTEAGDPEAARAMINSWRQSYGEPSGSPAVASSVTDFTSWAAYRSPVYYRGALLLDELRAHLGDDLFFAFLQEVQDVYGYEVLTTARLARFADTFDLGAGAIIRQAMASEE